jgi:CSLREA domain-containing protein
MWDRVVVILRGLGVALLVALVVPAVAQASTLTVTTTADPVGGVCTLGSCSLRQAIMASASGDTITFAQGLTGTIGLTTGPLSVTHALTITGPAAASLTVSGANDGNGSVFDINASGATVTISGLTITGGAFTTTGAEGGGESSPAASARST